MTGAADESLQCGQLGIQMARAAADRSGENTTSCEGRTDLGGRWQSSPTADIGGGKLSGAAPHRLRKPPMRIASTVISPPNHCGSSADQ